MLIAVLIGLGVGVAVHPPVNKSFIEIDFSTLPEVGPKWTINLRVGTTDPDLDFEGGFSRSAVAPCPPPIPQQHNSVTCELMRDSLKECKFKVEVVNETTIRIYGRTFNEKFYPVTEAKIESKELKMEQLPRIKNPPKAAA